MKIKFKSSRGEKREITASEAIVKGIADDGGLYVPTSIPKPQKSLAELISMDYQELAYEILKLFLDFSEEELRDCIAQAYTGTFDNDKIAPVTQHGNKYFLELFHGRTLAFKDMALSLHPHLMRVSAAKCNINDNIVILTATSGDTGKSALEGFAKVPGTKIIVFYPKDGVSRVQELQMLTTDAANTCVVSVDGNFDDAQTAVKIAFQDRDMAKEMKNKGYIFSSANSINIGRLLPQIVYYYYAYGQMVENGSIGLGDALNFCVPTGNFGNILAGYYAKLMGLPISKLICASNSNNVLYDFLSSGCYDTNREFVLTVSPSMDIVISSNLERLLYELSNDSNITRKCMETLSSQKQYRFDIPTSDFYGAFATEPQTLNAIKSVFDESGYVIDTHTAVAVAAYDKYSDDTNDQTPTVIVSTASPYKFAESVLSAIEPSHNSKCIEDDFNRLSVLSGVAVPPQIASIEQKPINHDHACSPDNVRDFISKYLS